MHEIARYGQLHRSMPSRLPFDFIEEITQSHHRQHSKPRIIMKQTKYFALLVCLFLSVIALPSCAQSNPKATYEPTSNWPYLIEDFSKGTILLAKDTVSRARLNIHLRSEKLQCIDENGNIAQVIFPNVNGIVINNVVYRFVEGKPMRQVWAEEGIMLMDYEYVDFELIDNGYMQGLASYARNNSDVSMRANWNGHLNYRNIHMPGEFNEAYEELRAKRSDGQILSLKHTYYLVIGEQSCRASQKDCESILSKDQAKRLKSYVKDKKLKWKNAEDLKSILRYMKQQM